MNLVIKWQRGAANIDDDELLNIMNTNTNNGGEAGGGGVLCEFCNERSAVLYCRADSARLCLLCDQHVHSTNSLSKKHLRSQICHLCSSQPVSVSCFTHDHDGLLLCQDCDWDAHAYSTSPHDRAPVDPFSGCPSAAELSSLWGLDLLPKKPFRPPSHFVHDHHFQHDYCDQYHPSFDLDCWSDLLVPSDEAVDLGFPRQKHTHPNPKKQQHLLIKQLTALQRRDSQGQGDQDQQEQDRENSVVPAFTANHIDGSLSGIRQNQNPCTVLHHNQINTPPQQQPPNFPSPIAKLPSIVDAMADHRQAPTLICDANYTAHPTRQIWDFNAGRTRGDEESGQLDMDYCGSDGRFFTNSYSALLQETNLANSRALGDMFEMNSSGAHNDIRLFNSNSHNPTASWGPTTSESNNLPIARPSSGSGFGKPKSGEIHFAEQALYVKGESARNTVRTKADLEWLAQNRGNAMQRYKEKKSSRRYEKQIRYESRKARADTRQRIKGRFVKATEAEVG